MTTLHATPYISYGTYSGFYFTSFDEYIEKYDRALKEFGCEEYEIQFIDGEGCAIFSAANIHQGNIKEFFEVLETLNTPESEIAFRYLTEYLGTDITSALDRLDDVQVFEGTAVEYAEELIDSGCFELTDFARQYFDFEAFANDLQYGGDICEIDGYIIGNANCI